MQTSSVVSVTCDTLVEFAEDAAAFAQGEPQFVNSVAPASSAEQDPTIALPAHSPLNQEPDSALNT